MSCGKYTKGYATLTQELEQWHLKYSRRATIGRSCRATAPNSCRYVLSAKSMVAYLIKKPENLHYILSSWPFVKWGMDIIGSFAPGKGQCKFLLVRINYFTKCIEVEPLTAITAQNVQSFVWKNIVCRFGLPHVIITDNG